ncbi:MAG TPA: hypothetical protein VI932_03355 [Bacteroidota bacterium]|nr:hypothetical protein [Bacteroidota bacterium]
MYEHKSEPLLGRKNYLKRVLFHFLAASGILGMSLFIGVAGYHLTEELTWIDSLLNASMILSGMGPASELRTTAGKLFASFYSLFSGIIFLVAAGVIVAPVAHRIMHKLHLTTKS